MSGRFIGSRLGLSAKHAELHLALAGGPKRRTSPSSRKRRSTSVRCTIDAQTFTGKVFQFLKAPLGHVAEDVQAPRSAWWQPRRVVEVFDAFLKHRVGAARMRCHGDLHLGQFLYTARTS